MAEPAGGMTCFTQLRPSGGTGFLALAQGLDRASRDSRERIVQGSRIPGTQPIGDHGGMPENACAAVQYDNSRERGNQWRSAAIVISL
jgi:hypothetical protein